MAEPVKLASIYTEVRIVPPTSLRGYRTHEELQESFLQRGRGFASHDSDRNKPRSGLDVANDDKYQFLNLLGEPGAGKSTFLRYVGLMALRSVRVDAASQELPDAAASRYRFNLVPVLLLLRDLPNANLDFAGLIDEELQKNGFPSNFGRTASRPAACWYCSTGWMKFPSTGSMLRSEPFATWSISIPGAATSRPVARPFTRITSLASTMRY